MAEASRLFETTWENLRQMDSNAFTRLYRKQALKFHPDQGGSQKAFVKLTKLYQNLMKKKRRKPSYAETLSGKRTIPFGRCRVTDIPIRGQRTNTANPVTTIRMILAGMP